MKIKLFYSIIVGVFLAQLYLIFWKPTSPELHQLHLRRATFVHMPGWNAANAERSLQAFQVSCHAFLKQNPEKVVGSQYIDLKVQDWYPACHVAMQMGDVNKTQARTFFQTWFTPVEFYERRAVQGLFTGYYMPLLRGSLTKTKHYSVPLYGIPSNLLTINLGDFAEDLKRRKLVGRVKQKYVVPFYTRAQIDKGAISPGTPVVAWVNNKLDRLLLEIEGSGIVKLAEKQQIAVGYAGENGAPYTSIAKVLIQRGLMTADNASTQHIRSYFDKHPNEVDTIFNQNKSFVFFHELKNNKAIGSQGVALTPGYSLAVDRKWIPMGTPMWLVTTRPNKQLDGQIAFHRLMIAQDTGGAIRGPVRGDVYWGEGERATEIAGQMKNPGHYWLLLPRHVVERIVGV